MIACGFANLYTNISYYLCGSGAWAAKSVYNSEHVVCKHAENFEHNVYTTSVALAVRPPSTY